MPQKLPPLKNSTQSPHKKIANFNKLVTGKIIDPNNCFEYSEAIYKYFREKEINSSCKEGYINPEEINESIRSTLIDWIVSIHSKLMLKEETLYLAVNYIDRYIRKVQPTKHELQLIGLTCLIIAAKYEEVYLPQMSLFLSATENDYYDLLDILKMEQNVLHCLNFDLAATTPLRFLELFERLTKPNEKCRKMAHYILESSLQDYQMLKGLPSIRAASAFYTAHKVLSEGTWKYDLFKEIHYNESELAICAKQMINSINKLCNCPLQSVKKKYSAIYQEEVGLIKINPELIN